MTFEKIEGINMNYYGSEEYNQLIKELDKLVYTKCNLLKPTNEVELDDEYSIKYYYYKDKFITKSPSKFAFGTIESVRSV